MKTGTGIEIDRSHFSAIFRFDEIVCPIGDFDPSCYPAVVATERSEDITAGWIYDQLDDSGLFSEEQIELLGLIKAPEFNAFIIHEKPMFTRQNVVIDPTHLTANFFYNDIVCPIGKFDPETYPRRLDELEELDWSDTYFEHLIIQQLEDSRLFDYDELLAISMLDHSDFVVNIVEK